MGGVGSLFGVPGIAGVFVMRFRHLQALLRPYRVWGYLDSRRASAGLAGHLCLSADGENQRQHIRSRDRVVRDTGLFLAETDNRELRGQRS